MQHACLLPPKRNHRVSLSGSASMPRGGAKNYFSDQRADKESFRSKPLWKPESRNTCASLRGKPFDPASFLARNFLRVSSGEWAPLSPPGSGKQQYLGAVRSTLHRRGDLQQSRLRAA